MPVSPQRPPFAAPPPDAPQIPATVQEPPARLGDTWQRVLSVGGLLFAAPLWWAIWWAIASWFGQVWIFLAFGVPGLVVIAAGVLLFCLEPFDWFQAFRYRQLNRQQDYFHRGLITQTAVWMQRAWALHAFRSGPVVDHDAARLAGIPVFSNGRRVWKGRVVDVPVPPPASPGSHYSAPGDSSSDYPDDAEIVGVTPADPDRDTKQLNTRAQGWTREMIALWNCWQTEQSVSVAVAKRYGLTRIERDRALDGLRDAGLIRSLGPGKGYEVVG